MPTTWQPAVIIRFTGPRFEKAAPADFDVAAELAALKALILKTAEALWRARHAARARLSKGFAEGAIMRFREGMRGGVVTVLERSREETGQLLIPMAGSDAEDDIDRAIALVLDAARAASEGAALPEGLPKDVLPLFGSWCRQLGTGELCELSRPSASSPAAIATYGQEARLTILKQVHGPGLELTEEVGYVPSIGQQSFELYADLEADEPVVVPLRSEDEAVVFAASREYERVRVRGIGQIEPDGRLRRFVEVDAVELAGDPVPWGGAESLWDGLPALSKCRPGEASTTMTRRAALPEDINVYVYGVGR